MTDKQGNTMPGTVEFVIGASASCSDGSCGKVIRVVINPLAQKVTHLVVEPDHRQGLGRLVPLDLVRTGAAAGSAAAGSAASSDAEEVRLNCTLAEFQQLDSAEDTQFVPGTSGYAAYGPDEVVAWPYYGLGGGAAMGGPMPMDGMSQTVTYDAVPPGEVAVRRGEHVHATDGSIGRVQGLVIDPGSHHVTHVLLQEGHLWGRKDVAIPISAVAGTDDGIRLNITKDQVEALPSVDIDHPTG
jgi:sporulation protein YlmC with PRC-barrel domain